MGGAVVGATNSIGRSTGTVEAAAPALRPTDGSHVPRTTEHNGEVRHAFPTPAAREGCVYLSCFSVSILIFPYVLVRHSVW